MRSSHLLFLFLPALGILCKKPDLPTPSAGDILTVNLVKDSIPADNYSVALITARVDSAIVDTTNTVTFTTDQGTFASGSNTYSTTFDLHGVARAYLKSQSPQVAHVGVTVGSNYTQTVDVHFIPSWPDTLYINVQASATNALDTRVDVTAQLYKLTGGMTAGLAVDFNAMDSAGKLIGTFTNVKPSDVSGNATGQFWLQDTMYTGFVYIHGKMLLPGNHVMQSSNQILFIAR